MSDCKQPLRTALLNTTSLRTSKMDEPNAFGITRSQDQRLAALLSAFESGNLWPSERPIRQSRSELARIRVHNDAGVTIPAWGVMRITGVETGNDAWRIKVGKPNTTLQRVYLVNGSTDIATSADGWGTYLTHAAHVLYDDSEAPAIGEEWGPQDDAWTLRKNHWGFVIVGGNTGASPVKRTVATQYTVNDLIGKSDGAITIGNTGTVSVWRRNETSDAWEDSTLNLTCRALGKAAVANKYAPIGWRNGEWLVGCWES